jgi:hypothetical protein
MKSISVVFFSFVGFLFFYVGMPTINYGFIGLPFTLLVLTFLWVMLSTGLEMSADKNN